MYEVLKPFNSRMQKFSVDTPHAALTEADVEPHTLESLEKREFIRRIPEIIEKPVPVAADPIPVVDVKPGPEPDPKKKSGKD